MSCPEEEEELPSFEAWSSDPKPLVSALLHPVFPDRRPTPCQTEYRRIP